NSSFIISTWLIRVYAILASRARLELDFLLISSRVCRAFGSCCSSVAIDRVRQRRVEKTVYYELESFWQIYDWLCVSFRLVNNCSKLSSSLINTSRALLPSNGPTMPAASS